MTRTARDGATERPRNPRRNPMPDDVHGLADGRTMRVKARLGSVVHVQVQEQYAGEARTCTRRLSLDAFAKATRHALLLRTVAPLDER